MTKAEAFNEALQLSKHHKPKTIRHKKPKDARRISHNESLRAGRNGSYELERSATGHPSRKSSRKSRNRRKNDSALRVTATVRMSSPSARAARPSGNPS